MQPVTVLTEESRERMLLALLPLIERALADFCHDRGRHGGFTALESRDEDGAGIAEQRCADLDGWLFGGSGRNTNGVAHSDTKRDRAQPLSIPDQYGPRSIEDAYGWRQLWHRE